MLDFEDDLFADYRSTSKYHTTRRQHYGVVYCIMQCLKIYVALSLSAHF
jgi:hypothetical protein